MLLQITDDGAGMPPARLEELNRAIANGERVGFGLVHMIAVGEGL